MERDRRMCRESVAGKKSSIYLLKMTHCVLFLSREREIRNQERAKWQRGEINSEAWSKESESGRRKRGCKETKRRK